MLGVTSLEERGRDFRKHDSQETVSDTLWNKMWEELWGGLWGLYWVRYHTHLTLYQSWLSFFVAAVGLQARGRDAGRPPVGRPAPRGAILG